MLMLMLLIKSMSMSMSMGPLSPLVPWSFGPLVPLWTADRGPQTTFSALRSCLRLRLLCPISGHRGAQLHINRRKGTRRSPFKRQGGGQAGFRGKCLSSKCICARTRSRWHGLFSGAGHQACRGAVQGTLHAADRCMATLLISGWIITSVALCLSLFAAAARNQPRLGEQRASDALRPLYSRPAPSLSGAEAISARPCVPLA